MCAHASGASGVSCSGPRCRCPLRPPARSPATEIIAPLKLCLRLLPPQTTHDATPPSYAVATQAGVLKVESVNRVWGRNSRIALFVGIALASYIYSLDGTTTYLYAAGATSSFNQHSLLGAIATAQAIVLAVTKPFSAKFADVFGRAEAFVLAVFFYCLGYIIIAGCSNVHTYACVSPSLPAPLFSLMADHSSFLQCGRSHILRPLTFCSSPLFANRLCSHVLLLRSATQRFRSSSRLSSPVC